MQQSLPSRLLGHYEYEIKLPAPRNNNVRRKATQIIQANLNTTILEMIQEVCKRGELEVKEYELCFEGRRLDPVLALRHANLPIHGVLELILKTDIPKEITVNVGLQLEGKRLTNKFNVEETLWSILEYWEGQGEKIFKSEDDITEGPLEVPVCNFLRQTIVGKEQLQEKTLRSLDLIRGSGIIRFFYRAEDQLGKQANVSAPLPRPSNSKLEETKSVPETQQHSRTKDVWSNFQASQSSSNRDQVPVPAELRVQEEIVQGHQLTPEVHANPGTTLPGVNTTDSNSESLQSNGLDVESTGHNVNGEVDPANDEEMDVDCSERVLQFASPGQLFVLGENNAMLYHGDDVGSLKVTDEPDDFFAVTARDVESMYRELKAKRIEAEEAPLLTSSLRSIDETAANERMLREHPNTTVRIRFPDRFVLQGSFATADFASSLNDFVRRYLGDPNLQFYLFTAPPKTPIDASKTLLEQNLLGLAIVYFGSDTSGQEKYLKDELYNQVSDPQEVFKNSSVTNVSAKTTFSDGQNVQSGSININNPQRSSYHGNQSSASSSSSNPKPGSSSAGSSSFASRINRSNAPSNGSVPKWFKPSTK